MNTDGHGFRRNEGFSPLHQPLVLSPRTLRRTEVRTSSAARHVRLLIRVYPCPSVVEK
jgi:hypothetical protein